MNRAPLILALVLAACTGAGEPSADNIRDALAQTGNRGAAKAEKLACKLSPDRPGYICDYRAPACARFTGVCGAARAYTGRFLHAGGRWQQVEDLTRQAAPDPVTQPLPGVAVTGPVQGPAVMAPTAPVVAPAPSPTVTRRPPAAAPSPPPPELSSRERDQVARWARLDARCRGDTESDNPFDGDAWDACEDRERLVRQLERRGLCLSPRGTWGACDR